MIIYKCDTCHDVNEHQTKCNRKENDVPLKWITIDINFYNNNKPTESRVKLIQTQSTLKHFCSNECFYSFFFYK